MKKKLKKLERRTVVGVSVLFCTSVEKEGPTRERIFPGPRLTKRRRFCFRCFRQFQSSHFDFCEEVLVYRVTVSLSQPVNVTCTQTQTQTHTDSFF